MPAIIEELQVHEKILTSNNDTKYAQVVLGLFH